MLYNRKFHIPGLAEKVGFPDLEKKEQTGISPFPFQELPSFFSGWRPCFQMPK
jgi:hypothetical protein